MRACVRACEPACELASEPVCVRAFEPACERGCVSACVRACDGVCVRATVRACVRACDGACVRATVRACVRACSRACGHAFVRACVSVSPSVPCLLRWRGSAPVDRPVTSQVSHPSLPEESSSSVERVVVASLLDETPQSHIDSTSPGSRRRVYYRCTSTRISVIWSVIVIFIRIHHTFCLMFVYFQCLLIA